jgi:uncharacterized protein YbjT (DUF2867 family)
VLSIVGTDRQEKGYPRAKLAKEKLVDASGIPCTVIRSTQFFVARYLKAVGDGRQVVSDPGARYFGGRVTERTLVPLGDARLGRIRLGEWIRRSQATT